MPRKCGGSFRQKRPLPLTYWTHQPYKPYDLRIDRDSFENNDGDCFRLDDVQTQFSIPRIALQARVKLAAALSARFFNDISRVIFAGLFNTNRVILPTRTLPRSSRNSATSAGSSSSTESLTARRTTTAVPAASTLSASANDSISTAIAPLLTCSARLSSDFKIGSREQTIEPHSQRNLAASSAPAI